MKKWFLNGPYKNIVEAELVEETDEEYKLNSQKLGDIIVPKEDCFSSKDACASYKHEQDDIIEKAYNKEIKTPTDLINFMLNHNVSCVEDFSDFIARKVAIEKAKEFNLK